MALELRQQLKLSQQLVMTPQLKLAIRLLQLGRLELSQALQEEMELNPVLEEGEEGEDADGESSAAGLFEETDAAAGPESAAPVSEGADIGFERQTALKEQDWEEYANLYESDGPASAREHVDPDQPTALDFLSRKTDLAAHLQWQAVHCDLSPAEKEVMFYVIGNINGRGYLEVGAGDVARETDCDEATAARVIGLVKGMDPAGVAAADLRECLLLQLERQGAGGGLAARIVRDHLHLLETRKYKEIVARTGADSREVLAAVEEISHLDPSPGREYSPEETTYVVPDVYVHKVGDEYVISINNDGLPRLRISRFYRDMLQNGGRGASESKNYLSERLRSAEWLIKSFHQRQRTLYRVVESLLKFQRDFFDRGVQFLKPLILRDVADDIGMHESTVSRVTSNKYVHTPQGVYELKYFFNAALRTRGGEDVGAESVRDRIRTLIHAEDATRPLSDNDIAATLEGEGIRVARRTVAKYREQLKILPVKSRRTPRV